MDWLPVQPADAGKILLLCCPSRRVGGWARLVRRRSGAAAQAILVDFRRCTTAVRWAVTVDILMIGWSVNPNPSPGIFSIIGSSTSSS